MFNNMILTAEQELSRFSFQKCLSLADQCYLKESAYILFLCLIMVMVSLQGL